jgi:hypothetical protein
MPLRSTVMFTTAASRSGKTYKRGPHFLLTSFIPNLEGIHVSNFPWQLEPWKDGAGRECAGLLAVAEKRGLDPQEVAQRVQVLPADMMERWKNKGFLKGEPQGPWVDLAGIDLSGWHLAIDECHNFCGKSHPPAIKRRWQEWLGEIGHQGCTIEFISQTPGKVADEIIAEAEVKLQITNNNHEPDYLFGIKGYYWNQLWAKLLQKSQQSAWTREYRKMDDKNWTLEKAERWLFDSELFQCYDSFAKPIAGGQAGTFGRDEWERYSWPRLLLWFFRENRWSLTTRGLGIVVFFFCVFNCGTIFSWVLGTMSDAFAAASVPPGAKAATVPGQGRGADQARKPVDEKPAFAPQLVTPEQLVDRNEYLEEESLNLRERLNALEERVARSFSVVAISPDSVTFRGGYTYSVKDVIDFGPFEGLQVREVDYERRSVLLSDGRMLRMGLDDLQQPDGLRKVAQDGKAIADGATAKFHDALRAVGGGREPAPAKGTPPREIHAVRTSAAPRSVLARPGQPGESVGRGGTVPR